MDIFSQICWQVVVLVRMEVTVEKSQLIPIVITLRFTESMLIITFRLHTRCRITAVRGDMCQCNPQQDSGVVLAQ